MGTAPGVPWINHVRVPVVISALLLVMFFPLILRLSNPYYQVATGYNEGVYVFNWLAVSGALFIGSAVTYAIRRWVWPGGGRAVETRRLRPGPGQPVELLRCLEGDTDGRAQGLQL